MKKIILLCFIAVCVTTLGYAQNVITGKVTEEGNLPLLGVTVMVDGTGNGTVTDLDGNFSISNVPVDATLVFTFIGMKMQEVPVQGKTVLNVQMNPDLTEIEQLVVVGYGTQKKSSSVAAISVAKGEDLLKVGGVTSVDDALQGMLPGVVVMSEGGKPGDETTSILIRGVGSWEGSSEPLILVDGVERSMTDVDPNAIASISVLKDAGATAVFGVRGANGVILVTTKRGKVGKTKVSMSANFGFKQPSTTPEFADRVTTYEMWNEALANDNEWDMLIPESTIAAWRNNQDQIGPNSDYFPYINWWDEMVKKVGYQQQYNLNISGGSDLAKYFVSLGYLNDGDIFETPENDLFDPSFNYKRFNWRSNFDLQVTKTTELSVNVAGKLGYRNQPAYRNDDFGQDLFFTQMYEVDEYQYPLQWSDGNYGSPNIQSRGSGYSNFLLDFNMGQRNYKSFDGNFDFKVKQDLDFITKGLSGKVSFSYSAATNYQSDILRNDNGLYDPIFITYARAYDYANPNADGTYNMLYNNRLPTTSDRYDYQYEQPIEVADYDQYDKGFARKVYYEAALNYDRTFGDHEVTGLALFSRRESRKFNPTYDIPHRQEDWAGRVTYAYKQRYLADINGSYNGSENFAPGLRFGFFGSGSVGWRISEEPFVKSIAGDYLNNLKVRYSYGTSGEDGSKRFLYQQSYTADRDMSFGANNAIKYGPLYNEGALANLEATWETSYKQNLGVEIKLFDRLTSSVDFYKNKREGILMDMYTPLWLSMSKETAQGNLGSTKNHGIELELGWRENIGDDLTYWVNGNYTFNEGRIVSRGDGPLTEDHKMQAGKPIGWGEYRLQTGYYTSLDDIYNGATPDNTGVQSRIVPGDFMYADYDANGKVDGADEVVVEGLKYPRNTIGANIGASYKGFTFSMRFYAVTGIKKLVPSQILFDSPKGMDARYKSNIDVVDRWTPENAGSAVKPALHSTSAYGIDYNLMPSTYFYRDASYVRLKSMELAYAFNERVLNRLKLSKLQVYANGNDLYTWTKLNSQLDPESNKTTLYPMVKRFNLGLRVAF